MFAVDQFVPRKAHIANSAFKPLPACLPKLSPHSFQFGGCQFPPPPRPFPVPPDPPLPPPPLVSGSSAARISFLPENMSFRAFLADSYKDNAFKASVSHCVDAHSKSCTSDVPSFLRNGEVLPVLSLGDCPVAPTLAGRQPGRLQGREYCKRRHWWCWKGHCFESLYWNPKCPCCMLGFCSLLPHRQVVRKGESARSKRNAVY